MDERLKYAPCGYIAISREGYIIQANQTFLDWLGYRESELLKKHVEVLLSAANKLIFHTYFYPNINLYGIVEELFVKLKNSEGGSVPFLLNGRVYHHHDVEMIECTLLKMEKRIEYEEELRAIKQQLEKAYWEKDQALSDLKQLHKEIKEKQAELIQINENLVILSNTDKLTGLNNRRVFQNNLKEQIQMFHDSRVPFSLLLIDIDYFKKINDTYGHQIGDEVLKKLAGMLKTYVRAQDVVARYGGEEFVMILPATGVQESKNIAERLREIIVNADWEEVGSLTVSIGIATFTSEDSEESIIKNADRALYASKENGRNRVTHLTHIK